MGKALPRYLGRSVDTWHARDGSEWEVETDWAEVGGRAECVGLTLRSFLGHSARQGSNDADDVRLIPAGAGDENQEVRPVRAEILRQVTMSLVENVRQRWVWYNDPPDDIARTLTDEQRQGLRGDRDLFERGRVRKLVGVNGHVLSADEALTEVAAIYREAWREGGNPTKAVADALSLSRSAAAKRVRRARDAGLLPETTQGRPRAAGDDTKES